MLRCPAPVPCEAARVGAFFFALSAYWGCVVVGLAPMVAHVMQGDLIGLAWVAGVVLGGVGLVRGIRSALSHTDQIRWDSLAWSSGVLGLGFYILVHRSTALAASPFGSDATRAVLLSWMASNGLNLWLQLRDHIRLPHLPRLRRPAPAAERQPLRIVRLFIIGGATAQGVSEAPALAPARASPELIQHNGKLYIEDNGTLVPLRDRQTVKVRR